MNVPQIPDSEWLDLVSPGVLREGKALAGTVSSLVWEAPFLRGKVADGARNFLVSLNLRSRTFPQAECSCELGSALRICRHALAVYFAYFAPLLKAAEAARLAAEKRAASSSVPARTSREKSVPAPSPRTFAGTPDAPIFGERGKKSAPAECGRCAVDGGREWISVVLPPRETPFASRFRDVLKNGGFTLDARSRRWFLHGEHKTLNFIAEHRDALEKDGRAAYSENFRKFLRSTKTAKIFCDARPARDGGNAFDLCVRLETHGVSEREIADALARGRLYVKRDADRIVFLSPQRLEKISAVRERLGRGEISGTENVFRRRFSSAELPAAENALEELGVNFLPPESWRERSAALRDLSRLAEPPVPAALFSRLRLYQQIGAAWLWHLHENGLGGLLADEMGLGKTVQAIAYLAAVFAREDPRESSPRALLVVPAGLIENWRRELARFAPEIPVVVHHGSQRRASAGKSPFPRGVTLTSYSTLAIDLDVFRACGWHTIIADEAQQIKNRRSRNARSLKELSAGTRFVLTGTPIENSHEDLRSLFEFLMPGFLPPVAAGVSAVARREWDRAHLKNLVAPYILRRTKSAVAPELPPRIEQTVWCRFGDAQSKLYEEWKTRSREEIFRLEMAGASDSRLRIAAFSQLLRLRQICTEPRVVSPEFPEAESAKLRAFRELLDEAQAGGHRMLVFSQFVSVLDFLAAALNADGVPFCRIDGSVRERSRECDRFNASPEIPVFLISLKAGGLGLNITGADTVVHYDPWWNPAAEAQATDRAHRIGQTRAVSVLKLAVADSVEERVLSLQREKRRLLEELFEASDPGNAKISLSEIKELFA